MSANPQQPVGNTNLTPQQISTLVQMQQTLHTPVLGLIMADIFSAGGGPVLGLAMGALADAFTGNVSAARQLSNTDVMLAIAAAHAMGLSTLVPAITGLGSVQTKLIVALGKTVQTTDADIKKKLGV